MLRPSSKIALIAILAFLLILYANLPGGRSTLHKDRNVYGGRFSVGREDGGYRGLPLRVVDAFPPMDPSSRKYREWNTQTIAELHMCIALGNCGPNQRKVALLASHWFEEAVVRGWRGGEGVWGLSMVGCLSLLCEV